MNSNFNIKRNITFVMFLCFFISHNILRSQGDTPCSAVTLTANSTCVYTGGTTVGASYQSNAANGGVPSCASPGAPDVWYRFTAAVSGNYVIDTNTGSITDSGMSLYSATTCSTGLTQLDCDDDDSNNGAMSTITWSLTAGNVYYVRVWRYSSGTGTFSICLTSPAPAPANDNCSGATAFPAVPTNGTCSSLNNQSNAGSTNSNVTPTGACTSNSGTPSNDVWFSFVATTTAVNLSATYVSGITDVYWQVFSGACASSMNSLLCTDNNSGGTIGGLTVGNTYYIRLYTWSGGTTVQNICVSAMIPPANDECSGATSVAVNASLTCTSQTPGTLLNATASAQTNSCNATYDDDDVWFSFVATSTSHNISLNNVTGNNTDLYHSVYSGSCGSISGALICSDPNTSTISGLTVGNTYFIRVYTWGTTTGANTTFSVCVTTPAPPSPGVDCIGATGVCGNASFSGNSSGEGVEEITASNQGCISFSGEQQSSWYFFKPTTGGSLTFTIVTSVDYDFAIWGPYASNATPASVCSPSVAPIRCSFAAGGGNTGLGNGAVDNSETAGGDRWVAGMTVTAGQVYVLLINNFAADLSSFSLNWGGTATLDCTLLPVELVSFKGKNDGPQNTLQWITASEKDNDFFTIEKSADAINFEELAQIDGAGNSTHALSYLSYDHKPYEITYYRLKQTNYDKTFKYSETISIDRSKDEERLSNIYPNPTKDNINFDVFTKAKSNLLVEVINNKGELAYKNTQMVDQGNTTLDISMSEFRNGVYLLKVTIEKTGKVLIYKVVKD